MSRAGPEALEDAANKVLAAIVAYIDQKGYPPTISELAEATGRSRGTIHSDLRRLTSAGRIEVEKGARAIRVLP